MISRGVGSPFTFQKDAAARQRPSSSYAFCVQASFVARRTLTLRRLSVCRQIFSMVSPCSPDFTKALLALAHLPLHPQEASINLCEHFILCAVKKCPPNRFCGDQNFPSDSHCVWKMEGHQCLHKNRGSQHCITHIMK